MSLAVCYHEELGVILSIQAWPREGNTENPSPPTAQRGETRQERVQNLRVLFGKEHSTNSSQPLEVIYWSKE